MSADGLDLAGRLGLRIAEAAEALGVSERHLRAHLSEIPHVYIGGCVVIPVDSVREWLREQVRQRGEGAANLAQEILNQLHE